MRAEAQALIDSTTVPAAAKEASLTTMPQPDASTN